MTQIFFTNDTVKHFADNTDLKLQKIKILEFVVSKKCKFVS